MSISNNEKNKNIKKGGQITLNNIMSIINNIISIIKNIVSIILNNLLILLVVIYYIMIFLNKVGLIPNLGEISSSLYSFLSSLLNSLLDIIKKYMSNNTDLKQNDSEEQNELVDRTNKLLTDIENDKKLLDKVMNFLNKKFVDRFYNVPKEVTSESEIKLKHKLG